MMRRCDFMKTVAAGTLGLGLSRSARAQRSAKCVNLEYGAVGPKKKV